MHCIFKESSVDSVEVERTLKRKKQLLRKRRDDGINKRDMWGYEKSRQLTKLNEVFDRGSKLFFF